MWAVLCIYFGGLVTYFWNSVNEALHEIRINKESNTFRKGLHEVLEKHGTVRASSSLSPERLTLWEWCCVIIASIIWPIALSMETYNA